MKISKNFNGLVTLGAIVSLASTYIAESMLFNTALLPKMITSCEESGFLRKSTAELDVPFQCQYTPMGLYALIGAIFFLILLTMLSRTFKLNIKNKVRWAFGYFVLTIIVLLFWREVLITNEDLTDNSHLWYSFLVLWLRAIVGMIVGAVMAITVTNRPSMSSTLKSVAATSSKAMPKGLTLDDLKTKKAPAKKKTPAKAKKKTTKKTTSKKSK